VLIWDNAILDNGDIRADYDQDVHGIHVTAGASNVWILENELARNSGDGIQIAAGPVNQARTHHVYVGRNVAHHNKQTGFWSKQAVDVIFSENVSYAHRPGNSSYGAGMGFQYAPERIWFIFNHVHDCEYGFGVSADEGLGSGRDAYFIGNVIHDIHGTVEKHDPRSGWSSAAFMLAGGTHHYLVNNTIHDVEGGIYAPPGPGRLSIVNNVISDVTAGNHILIEDDVAKAAASTMAGNLLGGRPRLRWGDSSTVLDLREFRSVTGKGERAIVGEALFVDPAAEDFRLRPGSPAIDAAVEDAVYAAFAARYGIDLAKDAAGQPRPRGSAWDIGAYEYAPPEGSAREEGRR
jgi:hypothetical protein